MTSSYDFNLFKQAVKNALQSKNYINQFVSSASLKLVTILSENVSVNINNLTCGTDGLSGWSKGYDVLIYFKLYGAELSITVKHKGFYELKYNKYVPSTFRAHQFLQNEEAKLIQTFKEYYNEHQLKTSYYLDRIGEYAIFKENQLSFSIYKELAQEIEQYTSVVGFKDHRFPIHKYVDDNSREIFDSHKYSIAFRKKEKMILLGTVINKKKNAVSLSALMIFLNQIADSKHVEELNSKSNVLLLDYLNS